MHFQNEHWRQLGPLVHISIFFLNFIPAFFFPKRTLCGFKRETLQLKKASEGRLGVNHIPLSLISLMSLE